jgi:H+/gluconate symporter-like permease
MFFDANTMLEIIFGVLQAMLFIGIIGVIEIKENNKSLKESTEDETDKSDEPKSLSKKIKYLIGFLVFFLTFCSTLLILYFIFYPKFDFNVFYWLQQTTITIFRILLGITLYSWDTYHQKMNLREEGGKN